MARMTPPVPGINTPGGEKIVFQKIKQTSSSINALHSLEIRDHFKKGKIKGEADFCVIYPNHGVFIIEVKGGEWEINNGQWYGKRGNTVQSQPLHESPFQQAEGNYYSISRKIIKQFPEMKKKLFGWGVVLPHASFPEKLFELDNEEWRVWDATNINDSFEHYLKLLATKEKQRLEEKGRKVLLPSEEDCEKIKNFLRPDYEIPKLIRVEVDNTDKRIDKYTNDQFNVLDQMIDNKRLVVKGGAGTGKTLIAGEAVRRNVQDNKQVLFLCKNREITDSIRSNLQKEGLFALYHNYPTIKTWDAFLEHEILDRRKINKLKKKYTNIGQYFNELPNHYLKICTDTLRKLEARKHEFGENAMLRYDIFYGSVNILGAEDKYIYDKKGLSDTELKEVDRHNEAIKMFEESIKLYPDNESVEAKVKFLKKNPLNIKTHFDKIRNAMISMKDKLHHEFEININTKYIELKNKRSLACTRYYFIENLLECYNVHVDFLSYLKKDFQHLHFLENNKISHFQSIRGTVYFSDKNCERPYWMHYDQFDDGGYEHNADYELTSFYHNILEINTQTGNEKKKNPWTYNFSKELFAQRIDNEINYFNDNGIKKFFNENSMYDLFISAHPSRKYDIIIVDESQDIVKVTNFGENVSQPNLNILHLSVKNGLFDGNWNFYLDPMQYSSKFGIGGGISSYNKVKKLLDKTNPTYTRLTTNCRNTKEISNTMFKLCDVKESAKELNFDYNINERVESGIEVIFHYYNTAKEIPKIINNICKPLYSEKVKGKDIQILSMETALKKYVEQSNQYFDIYTSNGEGYQGEAGSFENRKNYIERYAGGTVSIHQYATDAFFDDSTIYAAGLNYIHYNYYTPKNLLFKKYLSKEDSNLLIEKINSIDSSIIPDDVLISKKTLFESKLHKYFTISKPEIVSFHEKFYIVDDKGNRHVDLNEIKKIFDLDNWYREFSNDKNIFISNEAFFDNYNLNVLTNNENNPYNGFKLRPGYQISWNEYQKNKSAGRLREGFDPNFSKEQAVENMIEFCEKYKDFENKSAKHCTVYQFRGMDQKYVILAGFREITEKSLQSLYIGMSRAKVKLDVLAHKSLEEKIRVKLHEK